MLTSSLNLYYIQTNEESGPIVAPATKHRRDNAAPEATLTTCRHENHTATHFVLLLAHTPCVLSSCPHLFAVWNSQSATCPQVLKNKKSKKSKKSKPSKNVTHGKIVKRGRNAVNDDAMTYATSIMETPRKKAHVNVSPVSAKGRSHEEASLDYCMSCTLLLVFCIFSDCMQCLHAQMTPAGFGGPLQSGEVASPEAITTCIVM